MNIYFFFFFNDTATTEIYTRKDTLSLHDALPISWRCPPAPARSSTAPRSCSCRSRTPPGNARAPARARARRARCRRGRCAAPRSTGFGQGAGRAQRKRATPGRRASRAPDRGAPVMLAAPLIERKRDGGALTPEEWSALVAAYTAGRVPDYQMAALLMAVLLRGDRKSTRL